MQQIISWAIFEKEDHEIYLVQASRSDNEFKLKSFGQGRLTKASIGSLNLSGAEKNAIEAIIIQCLEKGVITSVSDTNIYLAFNVGFLGKYINYSTEEGTNKVLVVFIPIKSIQEARKQSLLQLELSPLDIIKLIGFRNLIITIALVISIDLSVSPQAIEPITEFFYNVLEINN